MAIEKSDPQVVGLSVEADGSVAAKVSYLLADGGTKITRVVVDVAVSNATSAELASAVSLRDKAAVLAVS
jgi:hypothetical protein